jgi:excisionase family DNA binding protein
MSDPLQVPSRRLPSVTLPPRLIRLCEAATILSVSPVTVRRRVRAGELPHIRIGGRLYFHLQEVKAYIDRHATSLWVSRSE